ncbi:MAG: hypothetical protein AAF333_04480 [Planctomycetota bacterium]
MKLSRDFSVRRRLFVFATGLACAVGVGAAVDIGAQESGATPVAISVDTGPRQALLGVGASELIGTHETFGRLSEDRRQRLHEELWGGLSFNAMRLWLRLEEYAPQAGVRDLDRGFDTPYLEMIRGAQAQGVDTFILSGDGAPDYMRETRWFRDHRGQLVDKVVLKPDMVDDHAAALADYVLEVRETHDIHIEAVTLQNEPDSAWGDFRLYYDPALMVQGVKQLRGALDERGLSDVKIIGGETANADQTGLGMLHALRDDPVAWDALGGIATHSYNMAATPEFYDFTVADEAGRTREYWQTEAASLGPENVGDVERGASLAARFLNDMNHGVTHWFHFIGYSYDDPNDNGSHIITYNPDAGPDDEGWITTYTKYYYLQQLTDTFDIGAVFRGSDSDLESEHGMLWTYGRKPQIVSSTAQNPDGSWGIAVVNYTSDEFRDDPGFYADNAGYDAEAFEVTIYVDELSAYHALEFAVALSGLEQDALLENEALQTLTMRHGYLRLTIDPLQLITLRSVGVSQLIIPEPAGLLSVLTLVVLGMLGYDRRRGNPI